MFAFAAGSRDAARQLAALVGMWACTLIFSLANLHLPWGRDQGIYAHAASRLMDGAAPYAEIFVFKPPATLGVHALAMALFGRDMLAIRLLDIGWTAATAGVLFGLARAGGAPRWAAASAGVLFAWQYHSLGYWNGAQTDGWSNLFAGAALWLALARGGGALARAALAGLAVGVVFWFKYSLGGLLPVVLVLLILDDPRPPWWRAVAGLAGFGASILAVLGWLWAEGALEAFWSIQNNTVLPYTGLTDQGLERRDPWKFFANLGALGVPLLALAAVGAVGAGARVPALRRDPRVYAWLAAIGWVAFGLLSAWSQGKFWSYQYQGALGGVALLAALGLTALAGWTSVRLAATVFAFILGTALMGDVPTRLALVADLASGRARWEEVYGRYGNSGMRVRDNLLVSGYLRDHTRPGDRVFVWGYDPMIYVLADRPMVSRFPYTYPMAVRWGPVDAYRKELMSALQQNPPAAIVIGRRDQVSVVFGHKKDSEQTLAEFPELTSFLDRYYEPRVEVGRFLVAHRRAP